MPTGNRISSKRSGVGLKNYFEALRKPGVSEIKPFPKHRRVRNLLRTVHWFYFVRNKLRTLRCLGKGGYLQNSSYTFA